MCVSCLRPAADHSSLASRNLFSEHLLLQRKRPRESQGMQGLLAKEARPQLPFPPDLRLLPFQISTQASFSPKSNCMPILHTVPSYRILP